MLAITCSFKVEFGAGSEYVLKLSKLPMPLASASG